MRLGNSNSGGTAKMRKGIEQGRNRKAFAASYVYASRSSGNSSITCTPLRLNKADGTYVSKTGSDLIKWTNDAGTQTYIFSFRDATVNSYHAASDTHLLTFSKGRSA